MTLGCDNSRHARLINIKYLTDKLFASSVHSSSSKLSRIVRSVALALASKSVAGVRNISLGCRAISIPPTGTHTFVNTLRAKHMFNNGEYFLACASIAYKSSAADEAH